MGLLCSGDIAYQYHLPYNCDIAQGLASDCSDKKKSLPLSHAPSCLYCLKSELIRKKMGDEVVSGAQIDECQVEVVTLII